LAVLDVARPNVLLHATSVNTQELKGQNAVQQQIARMSAQDQQRQLTNQAIAQAEAVAQARQEQAAIAARSQLTAEVNARLCSILTEATGDTQPTSPDDWYSWWNDYNDVSTPGAKPTKVTYQLSTEPVITFAQGPEVRWASCLVAGTPVWTELGFVAVEKIRLGDRVLACDCQSGQIMLKPVLQTIVNRGKPLFNLHTPSETLQVTGGHVFWGSGQGWVKARQLQADMRLHTLTGTIDLTSVEQGGRQDTYNLVVADFHTYFVGEQKILTHDNTIRKPTNCIVPGLEARLAAKAP
jgi:hypothetical protein